MPIVISNDSSQRTNNDHEMSMNLHYVWRRSGANICETQRCAKNVLAKHRGKLNTKPTLVIKLSSQKTFHNQLWTGAPTEFLAELLCHKRELADAGSVHSAMPTMAKNNDNSGVCGVCVRACVHN